MLLDHDNSPTSLTSWRDEEESNATQFFLECWMWFSGSSASRASVQTFLDSKRKSGSARNTHKSHFFVSDFLTKQNKKWPYYHLTRAKILTSRVLMIYWRIWKVRGREIEARTGECQVSATSNERRRSNDYCIQSKLLSGS